MKVLLLYLCIINIISFLAYGIDKQKAKKKKYRIKESVLLGLAFIGGSFGAFIGMYLFHHKTKHTKFIVLVPLFMILHIFLLIYFGF